MQKCEWEFRNQLKILFKIKGHRNLYKIKFLINKKNIQWKTAAARRAQNENFFQNGNCLTRNGRVIKTMVANSGIGCRRFLRGSMAPQFYKNNVFAKQLIYPKQEINSVVAGSKTSFQEQNKKIPKNSLCIPKLWMRIPESTKGYTRQDRWPPQFHT